MKKTIKLTESDLFRIVKKVLKEEILSPDSPDVKNYYNTRSLQIMKYPEKIPSLTGFDSKVVQVVSQGITDSIEGIGMGGETKEKLKYLISKGFTTLPNAIEISKEYKKKNGESLIDALDKEWMAGDSKKTIQSMIFKSIGDWCSKSPNHSICKVKSDNELKYGI